MTSTRGNSPRTRVSPFARALGAGALFVLVLGLLVLATHLALAQALLFPGMLLVGTVMDSTHSLTFYVLAAAVDTLLYGALVAALERVFAPRAGKSL